MKRETVTDRTDLQDFMIRNGFNFIHYNNNDVKQLRNCQAWIIPVIVSGRDNIPYHGWILQSYSTLVAISLKNQDDSIQIREAFRKYSPTTSKQTTWFFRGYWK